MTEASSGLVYLFTGEGKGKSSAGFWTGVRAAMSGKRVAVVCWYKEARWPTVDARIGEFIPGLKIYLSGKGFYKLPTDHASKAEHRKAAVAGLSRARKLLTEVEVLVLDEVVNAVGDKLVDLVDLMELISKRGGTHLILTGRGAPKELVEAADLVTEMKKIKHPLDKGVKAVRGLDY